MGRRINQELKVIQKGIGFKKYQLDFLNNHLDFDISEFCRKMLDDQIKIIDPEFWGKVNG
ncbi:MAG: hypothetical protein AABY22_23850 [Nanoarchaeota archaeon]